MSLLLRREVKPLLDAADLSEYHAQINTTRNPVIVGECGKPLFTLHGVTFSRTNPSVVEIQIATDLIGKFLTKHSDAITAALEAGVHRHTAVSKLEAFKDKHPEITLGVAYHSPNGQPLTFYAKWAANTKDGHLHYTTEHSIDSNKYITYVNATRCSVTPATASKLLTLKESEVKVATKMLSLKRTEVEATKAGTDALNFLNQCGV